VPDTRTLADRLALIERGGRPITFQQRYDAERLLSDLLAAAAKHGITLADFDSAIDLPAGCLDVIRAKDNRP
jgi:hypothetical protein